MDKPNREANDLYSRVTNNESLNSKLNFLKSECRHLLDKKFESQLMADFPSSYSELYFSYVLMKKNQLDLAHPKDEGPDIYIKTLDTWVEIITAKDGDKSNPNSIPDLVSNQVYTSLQNQLKLRLTSCISEKKLQHNKHLRKGSVSSTQGLVIGINGGWLSGLTGIPAYPVGGFPEIVQVLFGIGFMVFDLSKETGKILGTRFESQTSIPKISAKTGLIPIDIGHFLKPENSHISAVIYSYANINTGVDIENLGTDFITVHNPYAVKKLPTGIINCGIEYKAESDDDNITITKIDHDS